ncbi:hypothetical protein CJP74_03450 [Psittacicella melopsittaci]|uniref:BspA family leucine-rich repeat surface protein n=1 Tax=Psittacicella melopsittaci TaxID=2028576 RepID=A0A3A1Y697_9GAMM|nr:BspA family leucine-rich repeat surface protein [Psittacicella melopsittaci]RIY32816.1 hypothetical protein CJP74_03450 [Psittacicella melopsittaci]
MTNSCPVQIFTDLSYTQLPLEYQKETLDARQVKLVFTATSKLKTFLEAYIAKFNTYPGPALDLSFLDLSELDNLDYLFASQALLENQPEMQARPLNLDFNSLDLKNITSLQGTFMGVELVTDLSQLDVSRVTNMSYLFAQAVFSHPNLGLANWNVAQVTNMSFMFQGACFKYPQDLENWNVAQVTNMQNMFALASNLGDLSLASWQVGQVTNMSAMFKKAHDFNGNLSQWNTAKVTQMQEMFYYANAFNCDLSYWDVSQVTDMTRMFAYASNFTCDLSFWDTRKIKHRKDVFVGATKFMSAYKKRSRYHQARFSDISYSQLPEILQEQRLNPQHVQITFTSQDKLEDFVEVYQARFPQAKDLSFISLQVET